MEPTILFDVTNQHIRRTDDFRVVAKSKNYLTCRFLFRTQDWYGLTKTALFKSSGGCYAVILENDSCLLPWECLWVPGSISVSVYAGDLITADSAEVRVYDTGYQESASAPSVPTPSLYAQLLELLKLKADGLRYKDSILSLLAGEKVLSNVVISGGGEPTKPAADGLRIDERILSLLAGETVLSRVEIPGSEEPSKLIPDGLRMNERILSLIAGQTILSQVEIPGGDEPLKPTADGLRFHERILSLLAGETVLSQVEIPGGDEPPLDDEQLELAFDCGLIQPYQIGGQIITDENGKILVG